MPQYNRNELDRAALACGFTRDVFEKVLRLKEILVWMSAQDLINEHLPLKGGTAINLTIFNLPRLSVDIDMDFTPDLSREDMLAFRDRITDAIKAYMNAEGYFLSPASRFHHSLDAFFFTYTNAAGNPDMIKIELNYSLRSHILEPTARKLTTDVFGGNATIVTVDPLEIFAAKANALLSRAAARDLYDFNRMIEDHLFEDRKDLFRKSIVFYASISRETIDPLFSTAAIDALTFQKIRRDLFPVLTVEERNKKYDLETTKGAVKEYLAALLKLTASEKEYLTRFMAKEYRPELLFDDSAILQRIENHPMALWKCR